MKIFSFEQGTPEWRAARAGIATGSGFAAIVKKVKTGEAAARRDYRAQLVVEKLTGIPQDVFQTYAMKQGIEREGPGRNEYEARHGIFVEAVGFVRHDELEAGASPDGLVGKDGGLELKCPQPPAHFEYLQLPKNTAPEEYVPQVQGNLWLCEREWWDFCSYNPDFPTHLQLVRRRIYRDEAYIKALADEVARFMEEVNKAYTEALNFKED